MTVQDSDTLKSYWSLTKVAVPSNYVDLIDTIFAQSSSGEIGGLTISSNPGASASILASNAEGTLSLLRLNADVIRDRSGSSLTLSPSGDIVFDPIGNDLYPLTNYDLNLGLINKKFLTLHAAEIWAETLVAADTIATIGGRVLVGPTTMLTTDAAPADTTIYVKHNQMAVNDVVYLEANGNVEFMLVTAGPSGTGPYSYSVTRNLDSSGANQWYAGDAVFNTGNVGDGFIDLYSYTGVKSGSQYGPTIAGNVRSSTTYNDWIEHWAIGNLNGLYGYSADTYGFAAGKYANSESFVTVDATNGIRIRARASSINTTKFQVQADGDLFIGEDISAAATTFMSVFVNGQTYNGEAVSAGDVLLGDNTASKANILWDKSAGKLLFRGGVTKQLEIDTSGALVAGNGAVILDGTGLVLDATVGQFSASTINWWHETQRELSIGIMTDLGVPFASYFDSHYGVQFSINADNENFLLAFSYTSTTSKFRVSYGDIWSAYDIRVGYGLYVGDSSLNTNPGAGEIIATNKMYINDTANSFSTIGLTINQGSYDDEAITLKSSDIAHGVTSFTETDTYGVLCKRDPNTGGLSVRGLGEDVAAIQVVGVSINDSSVRDTTALACSIISTSKKSGTAQGAQGADTNALVIRNYSTTNFIFTTNGDMWFTGELTSYKNSTSYKGYIFVPLTTPFTSTNWDGNDTKTTGTYAIDLSTEFSSTLVGVKAVLVRLSGHFATPEYSAVLRPRGSSVITARMLGQVANIDNDITVVVPTDSTNFDIDVVIAGGSMTQSLLEIWGYWI